jgi:hypothetical protein
MKPYLSKKHITVQGILLLLAGSILLGAITGIAAYFISTLIYFLVIFPIIIGGLAMSAYTKLALVSKVNHLVVTITTSIITGLLITLAFYATPYVLVRKEVIQNFQKQYQIDAQTASEGFDSILVEKTGSRGFIGYMKLRANTGDEYEHYLIVNSVPMKMFRLELSSTGAWLYWLLESVLFTLPCVVMGYELGRRPYNFVVNDWYDSYQKQIGVIPLDEKERLLVYMQTGDFGGLSKIILPEGKIKHPMLEIYKQQTTNKKGDVLLSIKETRRKSPTAVRRKLLSRWEVTVEEFEAFEEGLANAFKEYSLEESTG